VTFNDYTPPTLSLSAVPATIDPGDMVRLSWNSSETTSCTASGGVTPWAGAKTLSGVEDIPILVGGTYLFDLSCVGTRGTVSQQVPVSVNAVSLCGNGVCEDDENFISCGEDCSFNVLLD
jgi:hypothetical protein